MKNLIIIIVSALFVSSFSCTVNAFQRNTFPGDCKAAQRNKFQGNTLCHGFPAGTLVKTPTGDMPIEQLKEGDQVYAYKFNGYYDNEVVVQVIKSHTDILIKITVGGESFFTTPNQLFLLSTRCWVAAEDLKVGNMPLRTGNFVPISKVEIIKASVDVYCPTITGYGNFCVSAHGFFVHDFAPIMTSTNDTFITDRSTTAVVFKQIFAVATLTAIGAGIITALSYALSETDSKKSAPDPMNNNCTNQQPQMVKQPDTPVIPSSVKPSGANALPKSLDNNGSDKKPKTNKGESANILF